MYINQIILLNDATGQTVMTVTDCLLLLLMSLLMTG